MIRRYCGLESVQSGDIWLFADNVVLLSSLKISVPKSESMALSPFAQSSWWAETPLCRGLRHFWGFICEWFQGSQGLPLVRVVLQEALIVVLETAMQRNKAGISGFCFCLNPQLWSWVFWQKATWTKQSRWHHSALLFINIFINIPLEALGTSLPTGIPKVELFLWWERHYSLSDLLRYRYLSGTSVCWQLK